MNNEPVFHKRITCNLCKSKGATHFHHYPADDVGLHTIAYCQTCHYAVTHVGFSHSAGAMKGQETMRKLGIKPGRPFTVNYEEMKKLRLDGMSYSQIAKKMNTDVSAVYRAMKHFGMTSAAKIKIEKKKTDGTSPF